MDRSALLAGSSNELPFHRSLPEFDSFFPDVATCAMCAAAGGDERRLAYFGFLPTSHEPAGLYSIGDMAGTIVRTWQRVTRGRGVAGDPLEAALHPSVPKCPSAA